MARRPIPNYKYCGCWYFPPNRPPSQARPPRQHLPLLSLASHSTILNSTSRTTLKQSFANPSETNSIEQCIYNFPLYDGVSIVGFSCQVGDLRLQGVVQEKGEARRTYERALEKGETAGLLAQSDEVADVFSTSIGNIPAGGRVDVEVTYVGELKHDAEADGIRFTIPTYIAPRYGDGESTTREPAADAKGIRITVDVDMADGSPVKNIQSPSHPISVSSGVNSTNLDGEPALTKAYAELSQVDTALDKDFVLVVKAKNIEDPKAVLETHPHLPHQRAIMATLVPKFSLPPSWPEIVFVVDRSGSMNHNVNTIIAAMKVFLKALTPGVKFNICSFGTKHDFMFPRSETYDRATLQQAEKYVEGIKADYGGTETLAALKGTVERRWGDIPLEMILLTDGDIRAQQDAFSYINKQVKESNGQIRLFPLGIGTGVSHSLIQGLARAGNGFAQSVQHNERVDTRIMRMLKGAMSPHITDYTLEVQYEADDDFDIVDKVADDLKQSLEKPPEYGEAVEPKAPISLFSKDANPDSDHTQTSPPVPQVKVPAVLQGPHQLPSLFAFQRTSVYLLLSPEAVRKNPVAVTIRATSQYGPLELRIPVEPLPEKGSTIHALAARKVVQDLEEDRGWLFDVRDESKDELIKDLQPSQFGDMLKAEAVRLGTTFQIANRFCSFVAVKANAVEDVQNPKADTLEQMQQRGAVSRRRSGAALDPFSDEALLAADAENFSAKPQPGGVMYMMASQASIDSVAEMRSQPSYGMANTYAKKRTCVKKRKSGAASLGKGIAGSVMGAMSAARSAVGSGSSRKAMRRPQAPAAPETCLVSEGVPTSEHQSSPQSPERLRSAVPPPAPRPHPGNSGSAGDAAREKSETGDANSVEALSALKDDERVRTLIDMQDFDGWWSPSSKLETLMRLGGKAFSTDANEADSRVWATVLVIKFFEFKMGDEEEIWEMIVVKAQAWLQIQAVDLKALEVKAEHLLSS